MHRVPDTNLVFAHIPKAAGQAVKAALKIPNETGAHQVGVDDDLKYFEPGFIRFCVVRDPIKRVISAYRYNATHAKLPGGVRDFMRENEVVDDINAFFAALQDKKIDPTRWTHFRSQVSYIAAAKPQIILRQEHLADDIQILAPFYGKPISLKAKNVTETKSIKIDLSSKNLNYLASLYADDIAAFGY